jgi:hypothetical protein
MSAFVEQLLLVNVKELKELFEMTGVFFESTVTIR